MSFKAITIYFENNLQASLFKHELAGQISDGYWENSSPRDHWQRVCRAQVTVDAQNPRVENEGSYFLRNYNFANKELIDCVGDRMKNIVMLAQAGYDDSVISDFDEIYDSMFTDAGDGYWKVKRIKFEAIFGTKENYDRIVNTDRISTPALRTMLRRVGEIVNSGSMRNRFKLI